MRLLENHTVCKDNVHSPQLLAYYDGMSSHVLTATVICFLFQFLWTRRLDCLFEMVQRPFIFFFFTSVIYEFIGNVSSNPNSLPHNTRSSESWVSAEPRYLSLCLPILIFLYPFRTLSQLFECFIYSACVLLLLAWLLTCLFTPVSTACWVAL